MFKFKITGVLRKEEVREYTRKKDNSKGQSRTLYIEQEGEITSVPVSCSDMDLKVGKIGEKVTVEIAIYPYYFADGKRKPAKCDYYIPNKK